MDTPLGNKSSYVWQSIWNARPLLIEGMAWRVGDGRSISIWGDQWLPREFTHAVQSPVRLLGRDTKVHELIDNNTRWWNIPLVEEIFNDEEACIICGLLICPGTQVDQMVWGAAKNGKFTV